METFMPCEVWQHPMCTERSTFVARHRQPKVSSQTELRTAPHQDEAQRHGHHGRNLALLDEEQIDSRGHHANREKW